MQTAELAVLDWNQTHLRCGFPGAVLPAISWTCGHGAVWILVAAGLRFRGKQRGAGGAGGGSGAGHRRRRRSPVAAGGVTLPAGGLQLKKFCEYPEKILTNLQLHVIICKLTICCGGASKRPCTRV